MKKPGVGFRRKRPYHLRRWTSASEMDSQPLLAYWAIMSSTANPSRSALMTSILFMFLSPMTHDNRPRVFQAPRSRHDSDGRRLKRPWPSQGPANESGPQTNSHHTRAAVESHDPRSTSVHDQWWSPWFPPSYSSPWISRPPAPEWDAAVPLPPSGRRYTDLPASTDLRRTARR